MEYIHTPQVIFLLFFQKIKIKKIKISHRGVPGRDPTAPVQAGRRVKRTKLKLTISILDKIQTTNNKKKEGKCYEYV